jgi:hypothetical protein
MAMSTMITVATAFAGLNVLLLAVLGTVWIRNYQTFRSPLILGLIAFAVVMAIENLASIYFFFSMGMLYSGSPKAQLFVAGLRSLEFVALLFLTYVTWQ